MDQVKISNFFFSFLNSKSQNSTLSNYFLFFQFPFLLWPSLRVIWPRHTRARPSTMSQLQPSCLSRVQVPKGFPAVPVLWAALSRMGLGVVAVPSALWSLQAARSRHRWWHPGCARAWAAALFATGMDFWDHHPLQGDVMGTLLCPCGAELSVLRGFTEPWAMPPSLPPAHIYPKLSQKSA